MHQGWLNGRAYERWPTYRVYIFIFKKFGIFIYFGKVKILIFLCFLFQNQASIEIISVFLSSGRRVNFTAQPLSISIFTKFVFGNNNEYLMINVPKLTKDIKSAFKQFPRYERNRVARILATKHDDHNCLQKRLVEKLFGKQRGQNNF